MSGPGVVSDVVDVYVFRRDSDGVRLLQLRRANEPYAGTWQPVMGRVDDGERAARAAVRELGEETGLGAGDNKLIGMWRLDGVHPYYMASRDAIVMSVRFACEVAPGWEPVLDESHDDARWVVIERAEGAFMWPNQRASIRDLVEGILKPESACREALRVDPANP